MDYLEQFNEQKKINEGLFDNILSRAGNLFSKTTSTSKGSSVVQNNPDFYEKDGIYYFGPVSTTSELNQDAKLPLLANEYDLRSSKLSFILLPGTEFHAEQMTIDLKKSEIKFFKGVWNSGPFYGKTFQGKFQGSSFNGGFYGPFTNYESHPTTFVEGTFRDTTGKGLLGMPNTITLEKARNRKFNLITIPVGHYLQFRSVNGITGYIKVLKRLDGISSNFRFEVLNGFDGKKSPEIINKPWDYFRQNWKIMEINPKDPINFGGLIQVPEGDKIKEMYISVAPATFETPAAIVPDVMTTEPAENEPSKTSKKSVKSQISGGLGKGPISERFRFSIRSIINDHF